MVHWLIPERPRHAALRLLAVACLLLLSVLAVNWSGLYNVAATRDHFDITRWFLDEGLRNSVKTHSMFIEVPPLDDPEFERLAAGHFDLVCASCHGSPASPRSPVASRMLPVPPPLSDAAREWNDADLFWIVKHGLKMTGMPAWVAFDRDDEVWAMVAFLKGLPQMDAETYRQLARVSASQASSPAADPFALAEAPAQVDVCARCHGGRDTMPASRLVPKLSGQKADYLLFALDSYANGTRPSGIMQPIAARLDQKTRRRLADYYAKQGERPPSGAPVAAAPEAIERGRRIAIDGVKERGIPPCLACHDDNKRAAFPILAGQYASYLAAQLRLWRTGGRDRTTLGAIMAPIARRLTDEQIDDVTLYFESTAGSDSRPVARLDQPEQQGDVGP